MRHVKAFVSSDFFLPLVFLLLYFSWSCTMPTLQGPDETMRLLVPNFIVSHGALPSGFDPEIINYEWGISYAFTPYGSSLFAAFFMWVVSHFTASQAAAIVAARFASVLSGAGTVFVCMKIGHRVFENRLTTYVFAFLCGLLPQFTFLSSYFNSDAFSIFCTALIIYSWVYGIQEGWGYGACAFLGISIGLCALSYYYAYGFILMSIPVYAISAVRQATAPGARRPRSYLFGALVVFLAAVAVAGWFFIRNMVIYGGDMMGTRASAECAQRYATNPNLMPGTHTSPDDYGVSPLAMVFGTYYGMVWWASVFKSVIAVFGYMSIGIPSYLYYAYCLIFAVGLLFGIWFLRHNRTMPEKALLSVTFVICILIPIGLSIYYSWSWDYQPQGRYILSGLLPFMFFVSSGFEALSLSLYRGRPSKTPAKQAQGCNRPTPRKTRDDGEHSIARKGVPVTACSIYVAMYLIVFFTTILPKCMLGVLS